jgi:hypothetical protein
MRGAVELVVLMFGPSQGAHDGAPCPSEDQKPASPCGLLYGMSAVVISSSPPSSRTA